METTLNSPETTKPMAKPLTGADKAKATLAGLRPKIPKLKSNYDVSIPRKLMEAICGTSINTLIKLESDGVITPKKIKHGGLELVTYGIKDVKAVFDYRKVSFKQKEEAEVISIFSQKGGVGKSAFTQHLGSMLSLVGKVLIVDLDAQGDATVLFGLDQKYADLVTDDDELDPTIAELMDWRLEDDMESPYHKYEFSQVAKEVSPTLDIIPSDLDPGEVNYSLNRLKLKPRITEDGHPEPGELHMIKEVLDQVKDQYDYILIDCPPNIETCNVSALFATNRVLIPLELEAKSLTIMRRNIQFLDKLRVLHPGFNWDKVLVVPNKFRRENIKIKALAALEDRSLHHDSFTLSEVVVPNSSLIDKLSAEKLPVFSATSRFGTKIKSSIPQAKEFTNYFWAIMHEILDIPLERLVFDMSDRGAN